jgi:hypothetical protein
MHDRLAAKACHIALLSDNAGQDVQLMPRSDDMMRMTVSGRHSSACGVLAQSDPPVLQALLVARRDA